MEESGSTRKVLSSKLNVVSKNTRNKCEICGENTYVGKGFECGKLIKSGAARYCPKCGHTWAITEEYYPRENPASLLSVIKKRIKEQPEKYLREIKIIDGACPECGNSIIHCCMEIDLNPPKILYTFKICSKSICDWPGEWRKEYKNEPD